MTASSRGRFGSHSRRELHAAAGDKCRARIEWSSVASIGALVALRA